MDSSCVADPIQSCLTKNHDLDFQRSSNGICIQILESGRSKAPGARRSVVCFFIRTIYFLMLQLVNAHFHTGKVAYAHLHPVLNMCIYMYVFL